MPTLYKDASGPPHGSVPVTVLILTKNEAVNIQRCIGSVGWAGQIIVIDSGSSDETVSIAAHAGAEIVEQPWLGFGGQRDFALNLPQIRHAWIYFVDADEWVSDELAKEVESAISNPEIAAFRQRFRLVFQGRWIQHCGWYSGSRITRLIRLGHANYAAAATGERPTICGRIGTLHNDLVDEDLKGLASWLHKHVDYAVLDGQTRLQMDPRQNRWEFRRRRSSDSSTVSRILAKRLYARLPMPGFSMFIYMYILRAGFMDGKQGLRFCLLQAWFRMSTLAVSEEALLMKIRADQSV